MPASAIRRFFPSARRACTSLVAAGLVLGLATTAGGLPAQATPTPSRTAAAVAPEAATEPLDPTFVQEGMPSPHGGQVVSWGSRGGAYDGTFPTVLPDGVYAVGIATDEHSLLVLRSDGQVDSYDYDLSSGDARHLPAPPVGTRYTAVSANWYGAGQLLRSDGVVVDTRGRPTMTPPEGLKYTAISGGHALRSDGALDPSSDPDAPCADMRDPGAGLRYTAVSARPGMSSWAALRSDGTLVYCSALVDGSRSTVVAPPEGTRFVGVDMGAGEALAATADGRVISSSGEQIAAAPPGRSIVSLSAMTEGGGAASLDDGSILSWGLSGRDAVPPVIPAGRDVFSAVGGFASYGQHWAIVVGDPIPVEVSVDPTVPAGRPLRVTDSIQATVSAALADGRLVPGQLAMTARAPDGSTRTLEPVSASSGEAEVMFWPTEHQQVGTHVLDVTFSGSPYTTTGVETSLDLHEPSPVVLTASGPTTWHQGTEDTLCLKLATEDGSPLWWPTTSQATMSVDGHPDLTRSVSPPPWEGAPAQGCLWNLDLRPGTYTAHLDYEGWGEADSASWTGQVVVLPPAATQVESDLPSSWRYGQMPDVVWATVTSDGPVPIGVVRLKSEDEKWFGFGVQLDASGRGRMWIGSDEELPPGTYPMVVEYTGGYGFLRSSLERTVTVQPAVFTSTKPSITGTPRVGKTLTAVRGSWSPTPTSYKYVWKAGGVAVRGATSSTFTVPASAVGKRITVTVTGLRQYYESSVTSAPTTAVAPGTFTAPRPTIAGTRRVGSTLTVSRGSWSPAPSSVTYVWRADGVKIATRTSNRFVIPSRARGKHLTVTVVGSRTGYTKKSVTSYRTATIR